MVKYVVGYGFSLEKQLSCWHWSIGWWESYHLFNVVGFFPRTWGPDILSCLLQNKFCSHHSFPFFCIYSTEALDCKQPLCLIQVFIYSCDQLCVLPCAAKLIHNFHLSSTVLIYFSILKVVLLWTGSALSDLIFLSVFRALQNNQTFP